MSEKNSYEAAPELVSMVFRLSSGIVVDACQIRMFGRMYDKNGREIGKCLWMKDDTIIPLTETEYFCIYEDTWTIPDVKIPRGCEARLQERILNDGQ